jgi:hypothetical protein
MIPVSGTGRNRKLVGSHRKKSENFSVRILLLCSDDFRCFSAGIGLYFFPWVTYNCKQNCVDENEIIENYAIIFFKSHL